MGIQLSKVCSFLEGVGVDPRGRCLSDIWDYDNAEFDGCHDFIQWMFPLPKPSNFFKGYDCPVLLEEDLNYLRGSIHAQHNIETNVAVFLKFLGLRLKKFQGYGTPLEYTVTASELVNQHEYWLKANDHNHLRINRMLQFLVLTDNENLAKAIFRCLVMIKCEFDDCITDETMVYWRNALTGYSY